MTPRKHSAGKHPRAAFESADDLPPIDDSLTGAQATAAIDWLCGADEDDHWKIGAYYNAIVERKLSGRQSPWEFVSQHLSHPLGRTVVILYGSVADQFAEPIAAKYGITKLVHLQHFARVANITLPADPGPFTIPVPVKGSTQQKPFADCSVVEIDAATRALVEKPAPIGKDDEALLAAIQKTLDTVAEKNASGHAVIEQTKYGLALTIKLLPWNTLSLQNIFVELGQFFANRVTRRKR